MIHEIKVFLFAYSGELFMEALTLIGIWVMMRFQLAVKHKKYEDRFTHIERNQIDDQTTFAEFRGKVKGKFEVLFRIINDLKTEVQALQVENRFYKMYGTKELTKIKEIIEMHERTLATHQVTLDDLLLEKLGIIEKNKEP